MIETLLLLVAGTVGAVALTWLLAVAFAQRDVIAAQALKIADLEERHGQEMPVVIEPAAIVGPGHARKGVTA